MYLRTIGRRFAQMIAYFLVMNSKRCNWLLTIGLGIVKFIKKNLSSGLLKNAKFAGINQITCKNCDKSRYECKLIKLFLFAIAHSSSPFLFARSFKWNQTTMRWSRVFKTYHFLKILANCVDSRLFHSFYDS